MSNKALAAAPIADSERVELLDVLRGFAVFGILLANIRVFSGLEFMTDKQIAALPTANVDRIVTFLTHMFVEGKFYSIFSMLFGIGFAIQMRAAERRGSEFA